MSFKRRLALLEKKRALLPAPPVEDAVRERRTTFVCNRLVRLINQAAQEMSPAEVSSFQQTWQGPDRPLHEWVKGLLRGRWCLPELAPSVMRTLLLAWMAPGVEPGLRCVCVRCGVEYPYPTMASSLNVQTDRFFEMCPHCGVSTKNGNMMWAHRIYESSYPWMEHDGCVGQPTQ